MLGTYDSRLNMQFSGSVPPYICGVFHLSTAGLNKNVRARMKRRETYHRKILLAWEGEKGAGTTQFFPDAQDSRYLLAVED